MEFINAFLFFIFHNSVDDVLLVGGVALLIWFVWFAAELWWKWINGDYDYHGFDASGGAFRWWR